MNSLHHDSHFVLYLKHLKEQSMEANRKLMSQGCFVIQMTNYWMSNNVAAVIATVFEVPKNGWPTTKYTFRKAS